MIDVNKPAPKLPGGGTLFELVRRNDESGVSGNGLVLQGVVFDDGSVAVRWLTTGADQSHTIYGIEGDKNGWERFLDIHVRSHPTNDAQIILYHSKTGRATEWNQHSDPQAVKEGLENKAFETLVKLGDTDPEAANKVYQKYREQLTEKNGRTY